MTKSKYHSGLTQIAKQYGLDISSKVVRDALVAAYKLGQKENSVRNKRGLNLRGVYYELCDIRSKSLRFICYL